VQVDAVFPANKTHSATAAVHSAEVGLVPPDSGSAFPAGANYSFDNESFHTDTGRRTERTADLEIPS